MTPQEKKLKAEKAKVTGNVERAILAKYNQLGKISLHEVLVLILFVLLAAFWILGKIGTGGEGKWNGWHYHFTYKNKIGGGNTVYANATMPALLICILLMIIPKDKKYYKDFANGGLAHGLRDPLLPWNEIEQKVPWGPWILIG
jgi:sodium-dependent dicarboxylate transporter 2/3/5